MDRGLLTLLSVLGAVTVGNLYLAQPLLAEIGRNFHVSSSAAGAVVTLAQVGYGAGVLFIVPLGDQLERRRLLLTLLVAVSGFLLLAACAPSFPVLATASLLMGVATVVPQVVVPYAASVATDQERASVLGKVQAGILLGILLARVFSGGIASAIGWRSAFFAAAALCGLLAVTVRLRIPAQPVVAHMSYPRVLASMLELPWREPVLRRAALIGALNFAVFTGFWTTLPFLLDTSYGLGPATAGLFGLVGAAGAVAAALAGRLIERKGTEFTQVAALLLTLVSFFAMWLGAHAMAWLVAGVVVMDAGVQASHLACQAEVLAIDPDARSRINGIYMFARFVGGAGGSALGVACWSHWGWTGFCTSCVGLAVMSFVPLAIIRPGRIGQARKPQDGRARRHSSPKGWLLLAHRVPR